MESLVSVLLLIGVAALVIAVFGTIIESRKIWVSALVVAGLCGIGLFFSIRALPKALVATAAQIQATERKFATAEHGDLVSTKKYGVLMISSTNDEHTRFILHDSWATLNIVRLISDLALEDADLFRYGTPEYARALDEYIHKPEPFTRQEPAHQQPVTPPVDDGVASEAAAAAVATAP